MDMKKYFIVSGLTAALCSCAACGPPPAKRNFNETEYSRESEESSLQDTAEAALRQIINKEYAAALEAKGVAPQKSKFMGLHSAARRCRSTSAVL